jgi:hypothetical protein
MKALVAKGDCAGARSSLATFKAFPVKAEAKAQAEASVGTCRK